MIVTTQSVGLGNHRTGIGASIDVVNSARRYQVSPSRPGGLFSGLHDGDAQVGAYRGQFTTALMRVVEPGLYQPAVSNLLRRSVRRSAAPMPPYPRTTCVRFIIGSLPASLSSDYICSQLWSEGHRGARRQRSLTVAQPNSASYGFIEPR